MTEVASRESLAERTRMYVDAHPSIKDCIAKGLINYSSLARLIMKDIGVGNEEALMIACRRYAAKLSVTTDHELSILSILKDSRLEMRTKTCIVTAKNDWTVLHKMDSLFKDMWNENSIMQCVQSASAVTIIADRMLKDRILDTVGRFNVIKVRENLVEIVVKSPEKIVDTAGVIAYLITNLSDAGINIEETVSCHTDTIFIVNEPDMINAYSVLTKCIQSAEETVGLQNRRATLPETSARWRRSRTSASEGGWRGPPPGWGGSRPRPSRRGRRPRASPAGTWSSGPRPGRARPAPTL